MLDLTMGGRTLSGEKAVEFFEMLPDMLPEEIKTEEFCNEYEYSLNRLRFEVRKSVPIKPKIRRGRLFDDYSCGKCGNIVHEETDKYCHKCGRAIDWR